eukprot:6203633-Pleurochrysis_carterae.AAC.2
MAAELVRKRVATSMTMSQVLHMYDVVTMQKLELPKTANYKYLDKPSAQRQTMIPWDECIDSHEPHLMTFLCIRFLLLCIIATF